jgi:hypothetical protein
MEREIISLPVPVGPVTNTVELKAATRWISLRIRWIQGETPINESPPRREPLGGFTRIKHPPQEACTRIQLRNKVPVSPKDDSERRARPPADAADHRRLSHPDVSMSNKINGKIRRGRNLSRGAAPLVDWGGRGQ